MLIFKTCYKNIKFPDMSLTNEDQWLLWQYSKYCDLIIDFGTCVGGSASIMAMGAKKVITIDRFINYPELKKRIGYDYEMVKEDLKRFLNIEVIKSDCREYAINIKDDTVDLLFIDGDHHYESVKGDYETWYPKVKKNAIIIFHDYIDENTGKKSELSKFVDELSNVKKIEQIGLCFVIRK